MGERYELNLNCPYCDKLNLEIYYAPTCDSDSHDCVGCKKTFYINANHEPVKAEDWTLDMEKKGVEATANMLSQEAIDKMFEEKKRKQDGKN